MVIVSCRQGAGISFGEAEPGFSAGVDIALPEVISKNSRRHVFALFPALDGYLSSSWSHDLMYAASPGTSDLISLPDVFTHR